MAEETVYSFSGLAEDYTAVQRAAVREVVGGVRLLERLPLVKAQRFGSHNLFSYRYGEPVFNADGSCTASLRTAVLKYVGGSFKVDAAGPEAYAQEVSMQVSGLCRRIQRNLQFEVLFGVGGNEFDGVSKLVAGSGNVIGERVDVSKGLVDDLIARVTPVDGSTADVVLVTGRELFVKIADVAREEGVFSVGGNSRSFFYGDVEVIDTSVSFAEAVVPCRFDESGVEVSSIFALRLGADGVFGVVSEDGPFLRVFLPDPDSYVRRGAVEVSAAVGVRSDSAVAIAENVRVA